MVAKKKKYPRRILKDVDGAFPPGKRGSAYAPGLSVRLLAEILKTLRRMEKRLKQLQPPEW